MNALKKTFGYPIWGLLYLVGFLAMALWMALTEKFGHKMAIWLTIIYFWGVLPYQLSQNKDKNKNPSA